jgi:hypothetical protein
MRTTVDISDELFRRAKVAAALRNLKFKDLVEEGLLRVLECPEAPKGKKKKPETVYDLIKDACGIVASGVDDLATNPKYLDGLGRD